MPLSSLHTAGVRMMEQNLRRRHPLAGDEEIRDRLEAPELHERPGAGVLATASAEVVEWRDREAT